MPSSIHPGGPPQLTVDQLRAAVDAGEIDTVIVAFTDMQGRLAGKRLHSRFFLDHVLDHGTEGCNYLLAVDVDMNTVDGYAISSWEKGYGDFEFVLDLSTLRRTPGQPGSAMVQCDLAWLDGSGPVRQSPRAILTAQAERAGSMGYRAVSGTELEFIIFENSFDDAWDRRYTGLTGANRYNVDYSILGGSKVEPVLRGDPQRDVCRRHDRRVGEGRVQLRPARDRLPLRRRRAHLRQPRRLQDGRQGDRGEARPVTDLHGQVRPARGQLVPHPPVPARPRRRDRLRRRRARRRPAASCSTTSSRACR